MKVRMRGQMSGTRNGVAWPGAGTVVELPDDEAAALCAQGMAEPIRGSAVEVAELPAAEKAVVDERTPHGSRHRATRGAGRAGRASGG